MKRILLATLALLACQMPVGAKEEACLQDRGLLEGTFVLVKSIPAVSIGESELDGTVFLDGQKISIAYHEGSCESWPSIQSRVSNYEMLFHPPFANEMCRQHPWEHWCDSERQKIPQKLIQRNMKVTVYDADEIEWKEVTRLLEPYGFAPGKKNYIVSFSDGSGPAYVFYFSGRDILINLAYLDNATGGKSRLHSAPDKQATGRSWMYRDGADGRGRNRAGRKCVRATYFLRRVYIKFRYFNPL